MSILRTSAGMPSGHGTFPFPRIFGFQIVERMCINIWQGDIGFGISMTSDQLWPI